MNIIQNTDLQIDFTLTDDVGTPYVIADLNAYEVYLYNIKANVKKLVYTYKNTNAGISGITVVDSPNGIIEIILNREVTNQLPDGDIYAEVKIRLTANSEYVSSFKNLGVNGIKIGTIDSSVNQKSLQ